MRRTIAVECRFDNDDEFEVKVNMFIGVDFESWNSNGPRRESIDVRKINDEFVNYCYLLMSEVLVLLVDLWSMMKQIDQSLVIALMMKHHGQIERKDTCELKLFQMKSMDDLNRKIFRNNFENIEEDKRWSWT